MSYEIPQNLQYEEKIVFGLTLKQFGWLALFGILAAIVYLKTPLDFYVKAIIALILIGIGFGFGFLDFFGHLKIFKNYAGSTRQAGYLNPKLDAFIGVNKIQDNTVFLQDGSLRAIIQVTPLHFSLLSPEEQHAIIAAYREFLNSLDFSVQIVMRTVNLSLNEYLAVLQKKVELTKNKSLVAQFDSFKDFIQKFVVEKKIKNRLFYLVLPVKPNFATGLKFNQKTDYFGLLSQLDIRVKVCQDKLKRANLLTKRLNTNELVSLTASFFEGFIEAENQYFSAVVTLKEGEKKHEEPIPRVWFNGLGQRIEPVNSRNP